MGIGTVVVAQRDFKVPDEDPIILGTFGIVTEDYGKSLAVHFAGCRSVVDVNSAYVHELGNDNWNDHILRNEAELATLRTENERLLAFVERVVERDKKINRTQDNVYIMIGEQLNNKKDVKEARSLLASLAMKTEGERDGG